MSKNKSVWHEGTKLLLQDMVTNHNDHRLFNLFSNVALNRFKWENLPKGIESRYIERGLFTHGQVAFYDDKEIGLICLPISDVGKFNVYGEPTHFILHGIGYNKQVSSEEIVRIINNDRVIPSIQHVTYYSTKIAEVDKAIDVNLRHQKTPYIVGTTKQNELSMKNLIKKIQNDDYAIYVDEKLSQGNELGISVESTLAPYLIDKLQDHKNNLIDEFLTIMGLNNSNSSDKKERLIVDEVNVNNGQILMYLDVDYKSREKSIKELNERFGLNVTVKKMIDELESQFVSHGTLEGGEELE